jgi:hypothetical protein
MIYSFFDDRAGPAIEGVGLRYPDIEGYDNPKVHKKTMKLVSEEDRPGFSTRGGGSICRPQQNTNERIVAVPCVNKSQTET